MLPQLLPPIRASPLRRRRRTLLARRWERDRRLGRARRQCVATPAGPISGRPAAIVEAEVWAAAAWGGRRGAGRRARGRACARATRHTWCGAGGPRGVRPGPPHRARGSCVSASSSSSVRWPIAIRRPARLTITASSGGAGPAQARAAAVAPSIRRSTFERISRATWPTGMSPAKVTEPSGGCSSSGISRPDYGRSSAWLPR